MQTSSSPATNEDMTAIQNIISTGDAHADIARKVEAKRKRFGRFVGLRGCESPSARSTAFDEEKARKEMEQWMTNEIRRREERDAEKRGWREKGFY